MMFPKNWGVCRFFVADRSTGNPHREGRRKDSDERKVQDGHMSCMHIRVWYIWICIYYIIYILIYIYHTYTIIYIYVYTLCFSPIYFKSYHRWCFCQAWTRAEVPDPPPATSATANTPQRGSIWIGDGARMSGLSTLPLNGSPNMWVHPLPYI